MAREAPQNKYPDILPPTISMDGWDPRRSVRSGEIQPRELAKDYREWTPIEVLDNDFKNPKPSGFKPTPRPERPADYYQVDNPFSRVERREALIAQLMTKDPSLTREDARRKAIQLMQGVKNPLTDDNMQTFVTADIKRKPSMATYGGYDQYAQRYMEEHPQALRPPLLYDDKDGAFVVYKETNNQDGFQPGQDQVKYVNGYYVRQTTFEKGEQKWLEAKQLARRTGADFKDPDTGATWKKQKWLLANGWVDPRHNKRGELIPPSAWNVFVKNVFSPCWKEALPNKDSPERKNPKNSLLRVAGKFLKMIVESNNILGVVFDKYGVREEWRGKPEYILKAKSSNLYKGLVEDLLKQYSADGAKNNIVQWIRTYVADPQMAYKPRDFNSANWRRARQVAPPPAVGAAPRGPPAPEPAPERRRYPAPGFDDATAEGTGQTRRTGETGEADDDLFG